MFGGSIIRGRRPASYGTKVDGGSVRYGGRGVGVDWLGAIRDFIIIIVALVTLAANVLLIILGWRLWTLVQELRAEVEPILASVQRTSDTVRGTSTVVGDVVIGPLARAAALPVAAQTLARSLTTVSRGGQRTGSSGSSR